MRYGNARQAYTEIPNMSKLIIIDDDIPLTQMLNEYLTQSDLNVVVFNQALFALEYLKLNDADLVLLDVMMPGLDGFETLKKLRGFSDIPVIMLTAKGDDYDKILGLELGADDYLAKPFNHRELLARINAIIRRFGEDGSIKRQSRITLHGIVLDTATQTAQVSGQTIELTGTEFQLLSLLMRNAGTLITKEKLTEAALGRRLSAFDRSLDMHISNIRKKLSPFGLLDLIKTVRGNGYLFKGESV